MRIVLSSDGSVELLRGERVRRGQDLSRRIYVEWNENESPIDTGQILADNMAVQLCITRPDGEQSGWYSMIKIDAEDKYYYTLQAWDTAVAGIATVVVRWHDITIAEEIRPEYPSDEASFIVDNGKIAQPLNISSENYNEIVLQFITPLSAQAFRKYNVNALPDTITYSADGAKTAPALYFNFEHNVVDIVRSKDSEELESVISQKKGVLFVNVDEETQTELFVSHDGNFYVRNFHVGETPEIFRSLHIWFNTVFGETEGTAYEGHKGKQNADNIAEMQEKVKKIENGETTVGEAHHLEKKHIQDVIPNFGEENPADLDNFLEGGQYCLNQGIEYVNNRPEDEGGTLIVSSCFRPILSVDTKWAFRRQEYINCNGVWYRCETMNDDGTHKGWGEWKRFATNGDLTDYQKKTDETLETESKEVVGAINELDSGKLDTITTEDSLKRAYTINADGTQSTTRCSINPMGGALPIYDGANLRVGENPTHDAHATSRKYVDNKFNGANKALSFGDYSTMISSFNALPNDTYNIGQNVMVVTLEVPDLWISGIVETEEEKVEYTYTSDEEFITALTENGYVQVGYYKLSALETQKVDLTYYDDYLNDVVKSVEDVTAIQTQQRELIDGLDNNKVGFEDYGTDTSYGIVKGNPGGCVSFGTGGLAYTAPAIDSEIITKVQKFKPIVPATLDLSVKEGLANSNLEWTEEEKANARELLGVLNRNDWINSPHYTTGPSIGMAKTVVSPVSSYANKLSDKTWLQIIKTPNEKIYKYTFMFAQVLILIYLPLYI